MPKASDDFLRNYSRLLLAQSPGKSRCPRCHILDEARTIAPLGLFYPPNTWKTENRTSEYECGERLICREYTVFDNHIFNVNFQYDIVNVFHRALLLKNVKDGKLHPLPLDYARSFFIFASCCTCHSEQGCSVDDEITIFDYNHFLVKNYPEWLWTAITRTRDLSKLKFF